MKCVARSVLSFAALAIGLLTSASYASTPVDAVEKLDQQREGNLAEVVLDQFQNVYKVDCDVNELAKFSIAKLGSDSYNDEKRPGTTYNYQADYLVTQKCLSGSTYVGASVRVEKAGIMRGSFDAAYNSKGGPRQMNVLKIEWLRDVDLKVQDN